ncbi:MAG: hypothetical protein PVJ75_12640, partial [Chloroflexota bacterium]
MRLLSDESACSESSFLVTGRGNVVLLLSMSEDAGYITGWDGTQWGEPERQEDLVDFVNPLNYREVTLACHQVATG